MCRLAGWMMAMLCCLQRRRGGRDAQLAGVGYD